MAIIELATISRDLFFYCVDECNTCKDRIKGDERILGDGNFV